MTGKRHPLKTRKKISNYVKAHPNRYWLGKRKSAAICKRISEGHKRVATYGANNHNWKGDEVGYGGLHDWVRLILGRPRKCEHCGRDGFRRLQIHWANKSHRYLRDVNDWVRLCVRCHRAYDKKN